MTPLSGNVSADQLQSYRTTILTMQWGGLASQLSIDSLAFLRSYPCRLLGDAVQLQGADVTLCAVARHRCSGSVTAGWCERREAGQATATGNFKSLNTACGSDLEYVASDMRIAVPFFCAWASRTFRFSSRLKNKS